MSQYTRVKTLLGHNGLVFSIECLQSFVRNATQEIWLVVFEDGTLTDADKALLTQAFPASTIIPKEQCEAVVFKKLQAYPACLNYRRTVIYARKIFDLMLYEEEDCLYIDSDIFFFQQYALSDFKGQPTFMLDSINAYSFKPGEFIRIKQSIFPKVNSGFFYFPYNQFDLDFIESLLQDPVIFRGYERGISWLEQTIWSFVASRNASLQYFDAQQVVMAVEKTKITKETLCVHLVSTFRGQFDQVRKHSIPHHESNGPVLLRLQTVTKFLRSHHFYADRIMRKLRRYFE